MSAAALAAAVILLAGVSGQAAAERRTEREVGAMLTGIPQHGVVLGSPDAPVTLVVYADLEDPDCRWWFLRYLPAIVREYVRPGALKIEYRSYKTNTFWPAVFVDQQTAALAAGAQGRLWGYVDLFYHEQGKELTRYVTEGYLERVARQVPGLNLIRWRLDRHSGRREEQTAAEDRAARALGLHVTPSFRIGRTGGAMQYLTSHEIIKYRRQNPIALPRAEDVGEAIRGLEIAG